MKEHLVPIKELLTSDSLYQLGSEKFRFGRGRVESQVGSFFKCAAVALINGFPINLRQIFFILDQCSSTYRSLMDTKKKKKSSLQLFVYVNWNRTELSLSFQINTPAHTIFHINPAQFFPEEKPTQELTSALLSLPCTFSDKEVLNLCCLVLSSTCFCNGLAADKGFFVKHPWMFWVFSLISFWVFTGLRFWALLFHGVFWLDFPCSESLLAISA